MTNLPDVKKLDMLPIDEAKNWYNNFVKFTKEVLKPKLDYAQIPGTNNKPTLLKPGAEKLRFVYNLTTELERLESVVDYDKGILDFTYKVTVKAPNGQVLAEAEGNANSFEPKWGYIWVDEDDPRLEGLDKNKLQTRDNTKFEYKFAIEKAETTGKYGKSQEYWDMWKQAIKEGRARKVTRVSKNGRKMEGYEMGSKQYRIKNPDVIGMKNTIMKMAQKRAFVGAILIATGASEFFAQDLEDMELFDNVVVSKPSQVVEGEVVEDRVEPEPQPEPAKEKPKARESERDKAVKWINKLVAAGKIELKEPIDNYTTEELVEKLKAYKRSIGK